ncbi:DUF2963 domain-containing protein [New Jersey aster yellows phytoplasma]|uniref:DUF2963 domain-containing protein n=1 Tax=New Jersey aster yellows phytoplasma TaxID=270520 RepID=UPI0028043611|nr:DUF2963 domain-containing protein [New Jersey aster yellows phytoplasma]
MLIILLLVNNKIQPKTYDQNQHNLNSKTDIPQEQENYNIILNKIDKEVDKLTQQQEPTISEKQPPKIKYPPKIYYNRAGTTIHHINEINQDTGKYNKVIHYQPDGKAIKYIAERDQDTMLFIKKSTHFYDDGKTIKLITEHNKNKDLLIKETYYNQDGTIKETNEYKDEDTY